MLDSDSSPRRVKHRRARTAAVSGFFGTSLEYYDFLIYGTAASLYFGPVFFPGNSYATLLSLASIGVAYAARPLGAVIWGHFGDRVGRKRVLLAILLLMGCATFLVGCLPSHAAIGPLAPVLLVALRVIQGLSAGGEQAGSALLAFEHAPDDRRGYYTSWTQAGSQLGNVLAFLVFLPLTATLSESAMTQWGWRIPFWASAVVVLFTYTLRRHLSEPDSAPRGAGSARAGALPIVTVLRWHYPAVLRIVAAALCIAPAGLVYIFGLAHGTHDLGLSKSRLLILVVTASLVMVITQPLFGVLSDRVGRKPVFLVGVIGSAGAIPLWLSALNNGNWMMINFIGLVLMGGFVAMSSGVLLATFLEMFPADVRFSGMAVSFMAGIVITGFIPAISQSIVQDDPSNWPAIAWMFAGFLTLSAVAVASSRETFRTPTRLLGVSRGRPEASLFPAQVVAPSGSLDLPALGKLTQS